MTTVEFEYDMFFHVKTVYFESIIVQFIQIVFQHFFSQLDKLDYSY
jgi:hypothetical protein